MTGAEIMAVVGFIVMLMGFLFGLWKYVESQIAKAETRNAAKAEAATALAGLTRQELSDYKLRAAETFANWDQSNTVCESVTDTPFEP